MNAVNSNDAQLDHSLAFKLSLSSITISVTPCPKLYFNEIQNIYNVELGVFAITSEPGRLHVTHDIKILPGTASPIAGCIAQILGYT